MKKIIFSTNTSSSILSFRLGLIRNLLSQDYVVYIVAPKDESTKILEAIGCKCIDLRLSRKGTNPFRELGLILSLYSIYKEIKPDIIFNYTIKPVIYGSLAAKMAKQTSIAVITGLGYTFINNNIISKISKMLYRFVLRFPMQIWFLNEYDKEDFIKNGLIKNQNTTILPGEGVNTDYFQPTSNIIKDDTSFTFLLIARMLWDKGIGEYYEAAKIIKSKYKNINFNLLGSIDKGNPKGMDLDTIKKYEEEGILNYLGHTNDVRPFIEKADCIVLPSYREGTSVSLLEAASMGKPLIATDVPGCNNVVIDGFNGYLCKVKDKDDLADKLDKMYNLDTKAIKELGENSRKFVIENFDESKVIEIYNCFLDDFYKNKKGKK